MTLEAATLAKWGAIYNGDALATLREIDDNIAHWMVTDPPAGVDFMGLEWDRYKSRNEFVSAMAEVFIETRRVLVPGAHALVWSLPKTSHWTACALEDAGFEIRDVVFHLYGEGMPKSHDISKAIDAELGVKREVIGSKRVRDIRNGQGKARYTNVNAAMRPDDEKPDYIDHPITAPGSPEAAEWNGWGTGLKPAIEGWILARAPLATDTVASNVLAHGAGAINIGATRIDAPDGVPVFTGKAQSRANTYANGLHGSARTGEIDTETGRWPSNFALSHALACEDGLCSPGCPVAILDEQAGQLVSGATPKRRVEGNRDTYSEFAGQETTTFLRGANSGTASRYFPVFHYAPKPKDDERHLGTDNENDHPTLKGIDFMRWLIRLVAPKHSMGIDPFFGSGTTGAAAVLEALSIVGIEKQAHYANIAAKRVDYWWQVSRNRTIVPKTKELVRKRVKGPGQDQLSLF